MLTATTTPAPVTVISKNDMVCGMRCGGDLPIFVTRSWVQKWGGIFVCARVHKNSNTRVSVSGKNFVCTQKQSGYCSPTGQTLASQSKW